MDLFIEEIEWAIQVLKDGSPEAEMELTSTANEKLMGFEKLITRELFNMTRIIATFTASSLSTAIDPCFKALTKLYRCLGSFLKFKTYDVGHGGQVEMHIIDLVSAVTGTLTQSIYEFINYAQQIDVDRAKLEAMQDVKGKRKAGASIVARAKSKVIPNAVYQIEQFERHLIALSKKSKVNLMKYCKRSIARDFRIQLDNLKMLEEEQDENTVIEDEENVAKVTAKRVRLA